MTPHDMNQLVSAAMLRASESVAEQIEKFAEEPAIRTVDAPTALRACAQAIRNANKGMARDAVRTD